MNPFSHKAIVVPVDLSEASNYALTFARQLASGPSSILAIHVGTPFAAIDPPYMYLADESTRKAELEDAVRQCYKQFASQGYCFTVRYGDPCDEITRYAQEIGAGLIVMPSHGRTGLRHLLIGSVAERVVRHAQCPVLVLRGIGDLLRPEERAGDKVARGDTVAH